MSYRKVGGLRFLRLGRISLSFCVRRKVSAVDVLHAAWERAFWASLAE